MNKKIDAKAKNRIIQQLRAGKTSKAVAAKTGFSVQQIAAVKAHMTMGTY